MPAGRDLPAAARAPSGRQGHLEGALKGACSPMEFSVESELLHTGEAKLQLSMPCVGPNHTENRGPHN